MSHLGRPKGVQEEFSLKHIVKSVEDILGVEVKFVSNCVGEEAEIAAANLEPGQILLLENLRFHEEEKKGDKEFAEQLSKDLMKKSKVVVYQTIAWVMGNCSF